MDNKEKLKQLVKIKGPIIPSNVHSELELSLLITSALMAEMVSNNILKISSVKIGGSPLYYLPDQEERLQEFSKYLHEKEKRAYELLKEKGILRDIALEPVTRVALREIKDFAVPLKVNYKDKSEIFWRWYLLPSEEAEKIIEKELKIKEPKKEIKIEKQETIKKAERPKKEKIQTEKTSFFDKLYEYFNKNKITIINEEINKRKTEANLIIEVPSAVGNLKYFCKVKDKKRINDSDLASAFVQGQQSKLPVLYLTTGQLTKKAKEMLNKEFKGMNVKQL